MDVTIFSAFKNELKQKNIHLNMGYQQNKCEKLWRS